MHRWFFVLMAALIIIFIWRVAGSESRELRRENARLREELERLRRELGRDSNKPL